MSIRGKRTPRAALLGLAAAAACIFSNGGSARADFQFSPTGTGAAGAQAAAFFDPSPGNALAQGGVTAIQNFASGGPAAGNTFQLYYQAAVGNVDNSAGNPITGGTYAGLNSTYQITAVASVTEVVTSVSGNTATFAIAPTQSTNSFLKLFESTGITNNNLTGAGFTAGTLIYQGAPIVNANGSGVFANNPAAGTQAFDQHSGAYPGILSVVGNGSSTIDFNATFTNPSYFVTPPPTVLGLEFVTSNTVPFKAIDPSQSFVGLGPGGTNITPSVGAVNGATGPDFQFVADAFVTPVPEPSSLCLTGLGLGGLLAYARRRRSQVA